MVKVDYYEEIVEQPEGIKFSLDERKLTVTGPKGEITKDFSHASIINIEQTDKGIKLYVDYPRKKHIALIKTIASHINNMIKGVTLGYTYKMKIVYSHFPITVKIEGDKIQIENFIGERSKRYAKIMKGVNVKVQGDDIIIEGLDKEAVSQTAANIQQATKIKDKDPRVFMDGIFVYQKLVGEDIIWKLI
ncbi:MAG: 50S ribosomal protein L6 [Candidatus Odinarchaeia archaeon]